MAFTHIPALHVNAGNIHSVKTGMQRSADVLTRLAHSHDASRFLEIPQEVAVASSIEDVRALFLEAAEGRRHLTLRGGGTSLSGQAISDDLLVDVRRRFRTIEVLDDGLRVRAGAGASVAAINARLLRHGRRIGPDPASAQTATIGGVIANNSTGRGAVCAHDAFATIESLVVVLPNGRVVDTSQPDVDIALTWDEPTLAGGLNLLRRRLREDEASLAEIDRLWSMRNSMGYDLRALTRYSSPSDMIRQLMVGSEGTLGFIAEVTLSTVALKPARRVDIVVFDCPEEALATAHGLTTEPFDVVQLFDVDALRVVQELPEVHEAIRGLKLDRHAALLLEIHAENEAELAEKERQFAPILDVLPDVHSIDTSVTSAPLWRVHHGVFTAMAKARRPGTTLLMEDFSVPLPHVGPVMTKLDRLFDQYGFHRSPITADLVTGTLHFMLTENFDDAARLRKFKRFVKAFVRAVLDCGGVLRSHYGTGRVMAPFLEEQVGTELYEVMRGIKHLFDPLSILSPRSMFNENPEAHVSGIKLMPTIEDPADRCVECGLCESVCPSADLTLTPRQRVVLRREIAARSADVKLLEALNHNYQYAAIDTCSTASICQLACPLDIDIGELVRQLKADNNTEREERAWDRAARNWGASTRLGAAAMSTAKHLQPLAKFATRLGREHFGGDSVWGYSDDFPPGAGLRRRPAKELSAPDSVAAYFPGCQQTFLGAEGQGVFAAFNELCSRAGTPVSLINAAKLCCGIPWKTRGLRLGYQTMTGHTRRALAKRWQEVVVIDSSACALNLREMLQPYQSRKPQIMDVLDFVAQTLLPKLEVVAPVESLLLYPSCANSHLGNREAALRIAQAAASQVYLPDEWACCGAHGDRGLLHPELPRAATRLSAAEIAEREFAAYASTTRSCEVAMSIVTRRPFVHLIEVLAQATRKTQDTR